jgi:hypothetical protein
MKNIFRWIQQPTTIGGMGGLLYIAIAYATGVMPLAKAIPAIAGAVFMIAVKDNTQDAAHVAAEASEIEKLAGPVSKG